MPNHLGHRYGHERRARVLILLCVLLGRETKSRGGYRYSLRFDLRGGASVGLAF